MSFTDLEEEAPPRAKRKSNDEVTDRVTVRRALAALVASIADLQREAVFLRAHFARQPDARKQLEPSIVTLGQGINAARDKLNDAIAPLSERQRAHSRVRETFGVCWTRCNSRRRASPISQRRRRSNSAVGWRSVSPGPSKRQCGGAPIPLGPVVARRASVAHWLRRPLLNNSHPFET